MDENKDMEIRDISRIFEETVKAEKCAAEIRQAGKRGITLSESLRHHPQHMVDGNAAMVVLRRFFIIIILS